MKQGRGIDYHGSSFHGANEPTGQFRLFWTWLGNIVTGRYFSSAMRAARPSESTALLPTGERGFSFIGVARGRNVHRRAADCAFPIKAEAAANDRDRRLRP